MPDKPKVFHNGLAEATLDVNVYNDVLKTFAKETVSFLNFGNLGITTVSAGKINRAEFSESEISPFRKHEIPCQKGHTKAFKRQASFTKFSEKKITLSEVQNFLLATFSCDDNQHRPYPSAGGLYPVEPLVFLFPERVDSFNHPAGCYHFRPLSESLQLIQKIDRETFYQKLMHGFVAEGHQPAFCILYIAQVVKAIFKYRYRGYRHALMEAGAMYQAATVSSEHFQLRNTVWCTFSEPEILTALKLDYRSYLPLAMQFFGYE